MNLILVKPYRKPEKFKYYNIHSIKQKKNSVGTYPGELNNWNCNFKKLVIELILQLIYVIITIYLKNETLDMGFTIYIKRNYQFSLINLDSDNVSIVISVQNIKLPFNTVVTLIPPKIDKRLNTFYSK